MGKPASEMDALTELADVYGIRWSGEPSDLGELEPVRVEEGPTENNEIGVTGTRFFIGDVAIEPTHKYRPHYVRGKSGNPRLYEEYYRSQPLILKNVQAFTELLVAGRWEVRPPEDVDDADVDAFVDFFNGKLRNIEGGWQNFVEHAVSMLVFGFSLFEIVWAVDEATGWRYPKKIAFREQNTVERWMLGERGDELLAVQFQVGGEHAEIYDIPADKLLLCNLNARGNNFEGIPPLRPAMHYIKMKRILLQIAALSAEKYGVPIGVVQRDKDVDDTFGGTNKSAREQLRKVIHYMRSADGPVVEIPDGLMFSLAAPPGTMPDLLNLINYCDQMITSCFSNEGSLLGMQSSFGSYALSETKERDFLRSAPYYARRIAMAINEKILKPLGREYLGERSEYPCLHYRVDAMKDSSRWLEDVTRLLPNGEWREIPEVASAVFAELGIDVPPDKVSKPATDAEAEAEQ